MGAPTPKILLFKSVLPKGCGGHGCANPLGERAPTYNFAKISQKLHEIERIWLPRVRVPRTHLDPLLKSA